MSQAPGESLAVTTDRSVCELMAKLMDELTTTGKEVLDPKVLKRLLQNSSLSEDYLKVCSRLTFRQLEIDHAQIRYSTLLLINELVKRSTYFRTRIFFYDVDLMLHFAQLTINAVTEIHKKKSKTRGTKLRPQFITLNLKKKAEELLHEWARNYGNEDSNLQSILFHFRQQFGLVLKNLGDPLCSASSTTTRSFELNSTHSEDVRIGLDILNGEIDAKQNEISQILTEIRSCFSLLVPKYVSDDNDDARREEESEQEDQLTFPSIPIQISVNRTVKVKRSDDNDVILENLSGLYKVITNRFIPLVTGLLSSTDLKYDEALEIRVKEMQSMLYYEKSRYEQLEIETEYSEYFSETSDDSDFEEVDTKPEWMQMPCLLETQLGSSTSTLSEEPAGSSKPFTPGKVKSTHLLPTRSCRALLKSGKLCPRQDSTKCPFHGEIVPRDANGLPLDSVERELEEKRREVEKEKEVDWQDPTFLKELKEKIGMDLTIRKPKKGKKSFSERYPGLIPITKGHSSRKRLQSKLSKANYGAKRRKVYEEKYVSIDNAPLP